MPNQLEFSAKYKSITSLPTIELPNFCLITGRNGSGKSHLLQAIKSGCVVSSKTRNFTDEISLFDNDTIVPKDTGAYSPAQASIEFDQKFQQIKSARQGALDQARAMLTNWNLDGRIIGDLNDLVGILNFDNFSRTFSSSNNLQNYHRNLIQNLTSSISSNLGNPRSSKAIDVNIRKLLEEDLCLILNGSEYEIFNHPTVEKIGVSAFQQEFGRLFTNYRRKMIANLAKSLGSDHAPLSEEEFQKLEGPKPWEFLNEILEVSNLDFRINSPRLDDPTGSFEPKLTKLSKNVEMNFADLSSGERVLMSFALCLYNSSENKGTSVFPRLLLLDEIDAPLHPDMVKFVLRTLNDVLVERHDISVIATTHSPTTVALFDNGSIYEMLADGPALSQISKNRALAILTAGVPTVSVTYEQRNQIFVESETDAIILSEIYQSLKSSIASERSVEFIKSGRKSETQKEENAGCQRVKSVVMDLRRAGVGTVFGLIDWDGRNSSEDGIVVICENSRYSIENLIFDPVIVISILAKSYIDFAKKNRILAQDDTFVGSLSWSESEWQSAVDSLLNFLEVSNSEVSSVLYRNGMKINVSSAYLSMRGHELSDLLCAKIGPFDGKRKQGKLEYFVARDVIPEIKNLLPMELIQLFETLTNLEPYPD